MQVSAPYKLLVQLALSSFYFVIGIVWDALHVLMKTLPKVLLQREQR